MQLRAELTELSRSVNRDSQCGKLDQTTRTCLRQCLDQKQNGCCDACEFPQLQPYDTGGIVDRGHDDFSQVFVIVPGMIKRCIRIPVARDGVSGRQHRLPKTYMPPKVRIRFLPQIAYDD